MTPPPMAIARGAAVQTITWHSCASAQATDFPHRIVRARSAAPAPAPRAFKDGPAASPSTQSP